MPLNTRRKAAPPMASSFPAAIGKGRILSLDVDDAQRAPGCAARADQGQLRRPRAHGARSTSRTAFARAGGRRSIPTKCSIFRLPPSPSWVADNLRAGRARAAALVRVRYAPLSGDYDLHVAAFGARRTPGRINGGIPADKRRRRFRTGFRRGHR